MENKESDTLLCIEIDARLAECTRETLIFPYTIPIRLESLITTFQGKGASCVGIPSLPKGNNNLSPLSHSVFFNLVPHSATNLKVQSEVKGLNAKDINSDPFFSLACFILERCLTQAIAWVNRKTGLKESKENIFCSFFSCWERLKGGFWPFWNCFLTKKSSVFPT